MSQKKYRLQKADDSWWKQNINCLNACPAHTNVPDYISLIAEGKFQEAFDLNRKANVFPAFLGRICMHPCEKACRRRHIDEPVAICALKRAAADHKPDKDKPDTPVFFRNQRRLAIVGVGPAELTTADDLARIGYKVTLFEALPVAGGMLNVGIPPYRLDRKVIQTAIKELEHLGVEIRLNTPVGKGVTLEHLQSHYDAVLIAAGAHEAIKLNIPGEGLTGVLHGVTFMRKVNLHEKITLGRRVAVIGGGNTAIDCARSARYLGAEEVTIFLSDIFSRSKWDRVEVNPKSFMTNVKGVFAVGDYITGPSDVISVIADAHRASAAIHRYLQGVLMGENGRCCKPAESPHAVGSNYDELPRQKMPTLPAKERHKIEEEVQLGFSPAIAMIEAKRCLRCDYNLTVDSERCILCAGCVDVCPYGCIQLIPLDEIESDKAVLDLSPIKQGAALILDEAFCIRCGLCMHRCPTGAIGMERFEW